LPAATPPSIARLLRRCLTRDPRERLSDIGVARLEIRDAKGADLASVGAQRTPARRRGLSWWMAGAGLVAGAAITGPAVWLTRSGPQPTPALKLTIDWPDDLVWAGPSGPGLVISPDGTYIAYLARNREGPATISEAGGRNIKVTLYLRDLRDDTARAIESPEVPYNPFFSSDSRQVGFVAGGKLWRVPVSGGAPFEIGPIDLNDRGVSWSRDGYLYSGGGSGVSRIPESGGARELVTTVDHAGGEVAHRFPAVVPGGRGLLFTIFKGSLEEARVAVVDLSTKKWHVLMDRTGHSAVYSRTGHLVYLRTGVLMAAPFDASRLEVTGPSVPIVSGVLFNSGGAGHYSLADTGTLAYVGASGSLPQSNLVWVDRAGNRTAIDLPRGPYGRPALSPDGTRVALEREATPGKPAVVVWDFSRKTLVSVTRDSGLNEYPIWMRDGTSLVFTSRPQVGAIGRLFEQRADSTGSATQISTGSIVQTNGRSAEIPGSVSPDGTKVFYSEFATADEGIKVLDLGAKQAQALVSRAREPRVSPDGRWIAYRALESGIAEVYVSPYPNIASGRWQISTGGANSHRWSGDSTELFYRGIGSNRSHLFSVKTPAGATFGTVRPQLVMDLPDSPGVDGVDEFDVAADGRFLLLVATQAKPPVPYVIVNWFETLKQIAPSGGR